MRRRAVEIEVVLLDVLAMIAFAAGEAEEAFFENWIAMVPHGDRETDALVAIADPRESILVPAVRARAGMVVREIVPGGSARAVVLAHAAPGAFTDVRAPTLPMFRPLPLLLQP